MDNVTHALVGLLCAEGVVRVRERRGALPTAVRRAAYAFGIIGNNLPDLDFTYTSISGKTFGYLLQHRGYTHTLVSAVAFAGVMLLVFWAWSRWRAAPVTAPDWRLLSGLALSSPVLHIAMDFANNYGVHPFWPAHDAWFYGDSLFIVEPSLWLAVLAPLAFSPRSRWLRGLLWSLFGLALAALYYEPFVPRKNALLFTGLAALLALAAWKQSPFRRFVLAAASFGLVVLVFIAGSRLCQRYAREQAQRVFPAAATRDVVATPLPANPFCWTVLLVQVEGERYWVRSGRVAVLPAWLALPDCPNRGAAPTAPFEPLVTSGDARVAFTTQYRGSTRELRELQQTRCEARAMFRFARVPYLTRPEPGGSRVLGDLRYDRKPGLDFADIELEAREGDCPAHVPPWVPPRADILFGLELPAGAEDAH